MNFKLSDYPILTKVYEKKNPKKHNLGDLYFKIL